jgi:hypothetical protein
MAGANADLAQLLAVLELSHEQKQAAEQVLAVAHRIDRLEAEIKALPEAQRYALMRYWAEPFLRCGLEVGSYERSFAELVEVLKSSLAQE